MIKKNNEFTIIEVISYPSEFRNIIVQVDYGYKITFYSANELSVHHYIGATAIFKCKLKNNK